MKKSEIEKLPYEELKELSLKKNSRGCATKDALIAQQVLWESEGSGAIQLGSGSYRKSINGRTTKRYDCGNYTSKEI